MVTPIPTPAVPEYFDYRNAAAGAKLSPSDVRAIQRLFETDYPSDLMLRELHILRACNALRAGTVTLGQVLDTAGREAA